jgi:7-cyano-7-deazaguanine synthase in queuosine biosynthesis
MEDGQEKTKRILLLSGGADSILLSQLYEYDELIFISYGQQHLVLEYQKAKPYLTKVIDMGAFTKRGKEVNCRNMSFIMRIVSEYGYTPLEIHLGTNKEDRYKDNNRQFYDQLQEFISSISFHPVEIETPLIHMTKEEILQQLDRDYYTD